MQYARRMKNKEGIETAKKLHGVNKALFTLCGKELTYMWYLDTDPKLTPDDITCRYCKKRIWN